MDLGCGTGSLTTRLARAFPRADTVGVDTDPLLLGLAEEAVAGTDIRLLARDLTAPGWADDIGPALWDAAVSSTALHWLDFDELATLYRLLAGRLRPGGVFVDADNRRPADGRELNDIALHVRNRRAQRTGRQGREVGFSGAATVWQCGDDSVLVAVR